MNKEDKKLQKHLVEEMMKVSKTNPDVMYYMESLMEYCLKIEKENNKQKEVLDKIKELIERKLSTETYQHLKKLYDDIDSTEEIWEDYEFEDLLDILELLEEIE